MSSHKVRKLLPFSVYSITNRIHSVFDSQFHYASAKGKKMAGGLIPVYTRSTIRHAQIYVDLDASSYIAYITP